MLTRDYIGAVLRQLREERGYTLRQLCANGMTTIGYLSEIERGVKEPSSEVLRTIVQALDVPMSYVLQRAADAMREEEVVLLTGASHPVYA